MKQIPHVDLETKKIYGCEPGSKKWFHEKGHIEFNDLESTSRLKLIQTYIFGFWMFSVTLAILNKYMLFISIPAVLLFLGIEVYEEVWCNKYAENCYDLNREKSNV